ncbi:MAG TPA: transposase [Bryobacteraceae bacterium]|nr:transposase [Bryobacteraceae bacterium]
MPRFARVVVPGCWHHVTQRGNHQQTVFFDNSDRQLYLELLRDHAARHSVRITGYCLMNNHVHLLAVPEREDGLARALGRAHNDYARWINLRQRTTGHLWQNRFFSCPLDESHSWEALRYVELNPVRAGLAKSATEWRWSSARTHAGGTDRASLLDLSAWADRWAPGTWEDALAIGISDAALLARIREATRTGRPVGSAAYVEHLEAATGRPLRPGHPGPRKKGNSGIA